MIQIRFQVSSRIRSGLGPNKKAKRLVINALHLQGMRGNNINQEHKCITTCKTETVQVGPITQQPIKNKLQNIEDKAKTIHVTQHTQIFHYYKQKQKKP